MSEEAKSAAGTVIMKLIFGEDDLGDEKNLTEWEVGLLNGIRRLCRDGLGRPDCVAPAGKPIQIVWQTSPTEGDIREGPDGRITDGMDAIWATAFEMGLLNELRPLLIEAMGRQR